MGLICVGIWVNEKVARFWVGERLLIDGLCDLFGSEPANVIRGLNQGRVRWKHTPRRVAFAAWFALALGLPGLGPTWRRLSAFALEAVPISFFMIRRTVYQS